jgi:hypothetical protein
LGRKSLGIAYATTTSNSTITSFSYGYTEFDADDTAGAIGVLMVLNQPVNATSDISHIQNDATIFGPTVTQVNVNPDIHHLDTDPDVHGLNALATAPTQWDNPTKPTTTWRNPNK